MATLPDQDTIIYRFNLAVRMVGGPSAAARIAGVSRSALYSYRSGNTEIPLFAALQLAQAAGVTLDWIAGIDGNRDTPPALFEGAEHWRLLTPEQQERIGSLALELVVAWAADERCDEDEEHIDRAVLAVMAPDGDMPLIDALREAFVEAIPREALEAPDGQPRIPNELWARHKGLRP